MTAGELLNQTDDENTIIRHSVNFPPGMYRALQEKAKKQYRSMSSIVLEACDFYLSGSIEEQTIVFLSSEKGRNLIKQIKQAAEYIGVPVSTLRDWDRTGKLKAVRHPVNGYRLYQRSELERILEEVNKKR